MPGMQEDFSLKNLNTFGIDAHARYYIEVFSEDDIYAIIQNEKFQKLNKLILGGGSNILFTSDFDGLVIKNNLSGISVADENDDFVLIRAASGEIWHNLVLYCIEKGFGGIENLSLIPGTVGAAPIQNIGAYGVELKDVFYSLEAIDMQSGDKAILDAQQCLFGYRDSIFKGEYKGRFFITSITLKLNKKHALNTSYGAITQTLKEFQVDNPDIAAVSKAVCHIRSSKLPNPAILGNAGSFFKNPEIDATQYEKLKEAFPGMPAYVTSANKVKIPAGWLIEHCGWRGKRVGNTGSHKDQALVLVNYGGASGDEIRNLSKQIQASVKEKFGIDILAEVNIL